MALFQIDKEAFSALRDKVVVISGGASGIGAATVKLLASQDAKVVIGDKNVEQAEALASSLRSEGKYVTVWPCDVTRYDDIYRLFKTAHTRHGRVDHAVSCAGIFEQGNWFDPGLTIDSVGQDPGSTATLDVNVLGSAYFSRVAVVFLRDGIRDNDGDVGGADVRDKSLTLISSVNAFRESPGLYLYQTSKHAIQGFMRASRKPLYERDRIRVNCVCPGVTESTMTVGIVDKFRDAGLFWQPAEAVAKFILAIQTKPDLNGKAIYVEGGDGWEFEDSFYSEQPRWLGEEGTRRLRINADAVNKGALTSN